MKFKPTDLTSYMSLAKVIFSVFSIEYIKFSFKFYEILMYYIILFISNHNNIILKQEVFAWKECCIHWGPLLLCVKRMFTLFAYTNVASD